MNVNPGDLNKKINIISTGTTNDADGYPTEQRTTVLSPWASFNRTSGTETAKANADFGEIKARFLIRYTNIPITRKMLVNYAGKDYNITYINDYNDSHEYIEIWVDEMGLE